MTDTHFRAYHVPIRYSDMRPSMYLPILDLFTVHEALRYIAVRDVTDPVALFKPFTAEEHRLHGRRPVGELLLCNMCGHRLPGIRFYNQHLACAGCEAAVAALSSYERMGRKQAQKLVSIAAVEQRNLLWGCTEGQCTALLHAAAMEVFERSGCGGVRFNGYDAGNSLEGILHRGQACCEVARPPQSAPSANRRTTSEHQCPVLTAPVTRHRSRTQMEASSAEQEVAEALLLLTDHLA